MKQFCPKHKVSYEDTETIEGKCPLCKFGRPTNFESTTQKKPYQSKDSKYYRDKKYYKELSSYKKIPVATQDLNKFLASLDKCYLSRRKIKEVIIYKKSVIKALREQFGLSFPKIGAIMKYKDHTTPCHLYNKIKNETR